MVKLLDGSFTEIRPKRSSIKSTSPVSYTPAQLTLLEQHRETRAILKKKDPEILFWVPHPTAPEPAEMCAAQTLNAAAQFKFADYKKMEVMADYQVRVRRSNPRQRLQLRSSCCCRSPAVCKSCLRALLTPRV